MGWTAGVDKSTGDLVTAAHWNNYMGNACSIDYLKTEADKIDDCSQIDVTGSRALTTVYQNTSGKIRFVTISFTANSGNICRAMAYVELGDDTPDVIVARIEMDDINGDMDYGCLTFIVPPDAYYKIMVFNSPTILSWIEWDMH